MRYHLAVLTVGLCVATSCTKPPLPPEFAAAVEAAKNAKLQAPFTPLATLQDQIQSAPGPLIIEFAQNFNCARCDAMVPTIDELRSSFSNDVTFCRVNYLAAANQYQLRICPTYLFVQSGQIVGRLEGEQPYQMIAAQLSKLTANITSDTAAPLPDFE